MLPHKFDAKLKKIIFYLHFFYDFFLLPSPQFLINRLDQFKSIPMLHLPLIQTIHLKRQSPLKNMNCVRIIDLIE